MNRFSDQQPVYKPGPGETWNCMDCQTPIESLKFPPRKDEKGNVTARCQDCYRKYREANPRSDRPSRGRF